jgi:single-strand DNA-binding protein
MNKILFTGNLGKDPEMKYLPDGTAIVHFSVASNRKYKDGKGNEVKETTWLSVSVFGKDGENCNEYLHKGSKVLIEGRLTPGEGGGPRLWTATDGSIKASYEVRAFYVEFLDNVESRTKVAPSEQEEEFEV